MNNDHRDYPTRHSYYRTACVHRALCALFMFLCHIWPFHGAMRTVCRARTRLQRAIIAAILVIIIIIVADVALQLRAQSPNNQRPRITSMRHRISFYVHLIYCYWFGQSGERHRRNHRRLVLHISQRERDTSIPATRNMPR